MRKILISVFLILLGSPFHAEAASSSVLQAASSSVLQAAGDLQTRLSAADAIHLLSRTGIGSRPDEVVDYTGLTRANAIEQLLTGINTETQIPVPAWVNAPAPHYTARGSFTINQRRAFDRQRSAELAQLREWWVSEMLETQSSQTERLVLFWHNHFVSDFSSIGKKSTSVARQNLLFRQHATGNFREFLKAVLRDPALLDYLDNLSNRKQSPNENLARELLELFTLGEGNYSESDIKNAARALTGNTVAHQHNMQFRFAVNQHDDGVKTIFGKQGNFDADSLADLILEQPTFGFFIAQKFWHAYVSSTTVDERAIESIAEDFRKSDFSIHALLESLLKHPAFWAPENRLAVIKSPVDLVLGTMRSRGQGAESATAAVAALAQQGQNLFQPPNVAGWTGGETWITPARLLSRMSWLARFAADESSPGFDVSHFEVSRSVPAAISLSAGNMMQATTGSEGVISANAESANDPIVSMESGNSLSMNSMAGAAMLESGDLLSEPEFEQPIVEARFASDDFKGAPDVRIELKKAGTIVWQSAVVTLKPGRDTLRQGVTTDIASVNWRKYTIPNVLTAAQANNARARDYDEVVVHFLNDLSDGDGDRNLYVGWVRVDGVVHHAYNGIQNSQCVPKNPYNAGYLYCAGWLNIAADAGNTLTAGGPHAGFRVHDFHGLNANQLFLNHIHQPENGKQKYPSIAFMLAGAEYKERQWSNLQVQIQKMQGYYTMNFDRYACWPDCLKVWPDCSITNKKDPYQRVVRVRFDVDEGAKRLPGTCGLTDLHKSDAELVKSIWGALPEMLAALADDRKIANRKNLQNKFNAWQPHLEKVFALHTAAMVPASESAVEALAEAAAEPPGYSKAGASAGVSLQTGKEPAIKAAASRATKDTLRPITKVDDPALEKMVKKAANWYRASNRLLAKNQLPGHQQGLFAPLEDTVADVSFMPLSSASNRAAKTANRQIASSLQALKKRGQLQDRQSFEGFLTSPVFQLK